MFLKEIVLYNFMPFKGEQKIAVKDGVYSINAQYVDNSERSNRAGKSSVVDAIEYGLFGTFSRSKKETDLIHNDENEMYVILRFDDGFTIKRGRTSKNIGILEVPDTDTADNNSKPLSQEIIDKYIGLSQSDFLNTCYFKQDDVFGFLNATQGEKKKFITRWIEKEQWSEYEDKAKQKVKEYESELTSIDSKINYLQESIVDVEELNENKKKYDQYLINVNKVIKTCEDNIEKSIKQLEKMPKLSELNNKKNELIQEIVVIDKNKLPSIKNKIEIMKRNSEERNACKKRYEEVVNRLSKLEDCSKTIEIFNNNINKLNQKKAVLENEVNKTREDYKRLKGLSDGAKCPVCNNDITAEHKQKEIIRVVEDGKAKKEELENIEKNIQEQTEQKKEFDKNQQEYLTLNSNFKTYEATLNNSIDYTQEIVILQNEHETLTKDCESLKIELNDIEQQISKFDDNKQNELTSFINENRNALSKAQTAKDETIKNIAIIENNIKNNEIILKELKEKDVQRDKTAILLERWRFVKYMFSQNGIVSYQIENSFRHIEDEINYLAEKLQMNTYIEFSALKQLNKWADKCVVCDTPFEKGERSHLCTNCGAQRERATKDELSVVVYHAGIKEEFTQDSGGGRMLIAICFRIAIARMLRRSLNSKCEFLILDEIFGSLDPVNRSLVVNLIMNFLQSEMGFKQIFMISHTSELKNVGSEEIRIVRKGNYSEIVA